MASSVVTASQIPVDDSVNILMVDDQPSKLLSYEAMLQDLGANLVKASSATEALEHLLKSEFAVILVDVCMPEQDGFELVEMIRQHHRFKQTAIIFVSAVQLTDLDRLKGYASGCVDYVSVPVVPEILRAKVAVFVDLYRKTRELAQLNQDLEMRVLERTAALQATETALKETDRRKDEFLAMLAHELRNPLAPMQNSLELLRRIQVDDPILPIVNEILDRQLSQMTRLIDDLMDVSRITRNKLDLRKENVEIEAILKSAIESVRPGIEAADQKLEVTVPPGPVSIQADAVRLAQVLSNLLSNANKYTPKGGVIQFEVAVTSKEVIFKVRDNGIGIEPADLPNLFDPFYQVNRSLDRSKGGLGIGLTLVRTIVEGHAGKVSAVSEGVNKGSEFSVRIPRIPQSDTDKPMPIPAHHEASSGAVWKVLVVDDNRDAADTLAKLLEHLGHEVSTAYDGFQAVSDSESFLPNLVFMDIGMPEMNGYDAVSTIKAQPWGKEMVVVALTGWGQEQDRLMSAKAGFDYHLVKPVGFKEIEFILNEMMERQRVPAQS